MSVNSTNAAFVAVREAQPDVLTRDGTERLLRDVRRLRSWLDSVEMAATRRLRELSAAGHAEPPESLIAAAVGRTCREAAAVSDRTDLCDEAPSLADSLANGDVTATHLDAINAAARDLPDHVRAEFLGHSEDLSDRAQRIGVEAFRRECRDLAKHLLATSRKDSDVDELEEQRAASTLSRWVDRVTGMHHTHLELDPVRDARLTATFNAELARLRAVDGSSGRPWQQLQVDAFVNAIAGIRTPGRADVDASAGGEPASGGSGGGPDVDGGVGHERDAVSCVRRIDRVPELTVLVSWERLTGDAAVGGGCETENGIPLPVSTVRRLCCDAEIIPTLLGTAGEVLDQGRSVRTATKAQRTALRAMHRGCAHPDCGVGFDACRIHHVRWWGRDNGATDLANLLPLCERHHHLVHEGRWTLTVDSERNATWTRPDGVVHHTGPTIDRVPSGSRSRSG